MNTETKDTLQEAKNYIRANFTLCAVRPCPEGQGCKAPTKLW